MPAAADRLVIALAQISAIVGDIDGNLARLRAARAESAALRRRPRDGARAVSRRLSAGGPRAQAGVPGGVPDRLRDAGARDGRRRPGDAGRPAVGEDGALYNAMALLAGGRIEAVRFKVDLPNYGVFDEKRVFAPGPDAGPDRLSRRAHRRADLRGHLGARSGRMHRRDRRRNPAGAQRLALRARQAGDAAEHRGGARRRERPAADLSQPGRRPGRARFRRRLLRAERRSLRSPRSCRPSGRWSRARSGSAATRAGAASRGRARSSRRATRPTTPPACWACATMSRTTVSPASSSGLSGGIDFGAVRGDGGRRAGAGARARGDAALPLHLEWNRSPTPRRAPRR